MIEYKQGNLLDVQQGIIIHGCNAQGVMGSGVALAVKKKYPEAYLAYHQYHLANKLQLGDVVIYRHSNELVILNAVTQHYFGTEKRHVNYVAVAEVFTKACKLAYDSELELHFPRIGAGLGGGDWLIIEQLIVDSDPGNLVKKICWDFNPL